MRRRMSLLGSGKIVQWSFTASHATFTDRLVNIHVDPHKAKPDADNRDFLNGKVFVLNTFSQHFVWESHTQVFRSIVIFREENSIPNFNDAGGFSL